MQAQPSAYPSWSLTWTCTQNGCQHRTKLSFARLFGITVPGPHGGTRKAAAFKCSKCSHVTSIETGFLPKGSVLELPMQAAWEDAQPSPIKVVPQAHSTIASGDGLAMVTRPTTAATPVPAPTPTFIPVWVTSQRAFAMLCSDIQRALRTGGDIVPMGHDETGKTCAWAIDEEDLQPDRILDTLDDMDCELLIIGGIDNEGNRWKTLFHPLAGAATMLLEPIE